MPLRVMLILGLVVLMLFAVVWFRRGSQVVPPPPAKPIGQSTLSHGGGQGTQK